MMKMLIDKKILFVSDVASQLSCSSYKIYDMLHNGELKGFRSGKKGTWHILPEELDKYLTKKMNDTENL